MFQIWLTNHDRFASQTFEHKGDAIKEGKRIGFEFSIWRNNQQHYSWNPLNGCTFDSTESYY